MHEDVIVFDGHCVLCNGWVRFLLRHDHRHRYAFAAMQGAAGAALLERHGLDPRNPASMLLIADGRAFVDTEALLRVLHGLGGAWRAFAALRVMPARLRDSLYRLVARNRYLWFGRTAMCAVPAPADRARFLD